MPTEFQKSPPAYETTRIEHCVWPLWKMKLLAYMLPWRWTLIRLGSGEIIGVMRR